LDITKNINHFVFSRIDTEGGYADIEDFNLVEPLADRSNNIPLNKTITLTNFDTKFLVWANPHGMMYSARQESEEAKGIGCLFKVRDRGKGRVVLEAMNGKEFLMVVGIGLSDDVQLMKEESEGSLFQWQDMLHNQRMLLSLKPNRFIGLIPGTGDPYSADKAGTTPNRKDGSVFSLKIVYSE
jgi:xylan 1,4-beta-xylosidase